MFKQNRLTLGEVQKGLLIFNSIHLRHIEPDFVKVLKLSKRNYSPLSALICPEKAIWMATSGLYPIFAMVCR